MEITVLIMAGGRGERFWPLSRENFPKQFLDLLGEGKTMLQMTAERVRTFASPGEIFIATNDGDLEIVREQLPWLPEENIFTEPAGRNTAPSIGLAALRIQKKVGEALMVVLPSDHLIQSTETFQSTLGIALNKALEGENLVTIGVTPTYPETGYGYIRYDAGSYDGNACRVERFVEKPPLEQAQEYLESGEYLWNSGMFAFRISTILKELRKHLPEMMESLQKIGDAVGTPDERGVLKDIYPKIAPESVDYGVMEKASDIYVVPGTFGWDDVGSWRAFERIRQCDEDGNVVIGNAVLLNSRGNVVRGKKKLIAAAGISDLLIVDTEDILLVTKKDNAGDVSRILSELREEGRSDYL